MPIITHATIFEAELRRLIAEEIERGRSKLESTHQTEGMTAYLRGQIAALRKMDDLMALAQDVLNKRNA